MRFLFAWLLALAMAFAPFAMPMGEARAVATTGHHSEMMQADHCDGQAPGQHNSPKEKPCCAAGCMAAAMLPAMGGEAVKLPVAVERPGLDRFRLGVPAEIATPPPRAS